MDTHKNFGVVAIIGGALLVILVTFFVSVLPGMLQSTTYLKLGDGVFDAKVVATESGRSKGLAGVTALNANQALLMVFPDQEKWGIWMKDMKIPIDIIWLNSDKKVVYAVTDVSPDISTSEAFSPKLPAKYVVELPAGTVKDKAITTSSVAIFNIGATVGMK
jgi:uncharacterized protein